NIGLIDFSGVTIDSDGYFNGYASGDITGQINFNCANNSACDSLDYKVRTDWRPRSVRPTCNNALDDDGDGLTDYPADLGCESLTDNNEINPSGLSPSVQNPPTPPTEPPTADNPTGGFNVSINNGTEYTRSKDVTLKLSGGPDTQKMAISNFSDFRGANLIPYQEEISWELDQAKTENEYTVYVKFYTRYGQPSVVVSDTVILDEAPPEIPIIIYPSNGSVVKIDKPNFHGTAEKETQISLELLSGQKTLSKATYASDEEGKWSYSIPMPLADGNYQLKIYAKDEAQNISETATSNFSIQTFVWPTQEIETTTEPSINTTEEEPTTPAVQESTKKTSTVPTTEEPTSPQTQPSTEPTEPTGEENPTTATSNEETPSAPVAQPTTEQDTHLTTQTESQSQVKTEEVIIKSVYGNLNLAPVSATYTTGKETISAIHAFPSQTVVFSVKPAKPVFGVAGQILFNGETAQITPEEQKENPSFQSLIDFLKPAAALAQSETDQTSPAEGGWKMQDFTYLDEDNDGIYTAEIQLPNAANPYTLKTLLYYKDGTIKSLDTPILIDPQGYVYEGIDGQELRINKAVVSLYSLNPETKQYELWDASPYEQENPQETDKDGIYSFLAPKGIYYITVQAEGYHPFESQKFDVQEGAPIVNLNLELQKEKEAKFNGIKTVIGFVAGMIGLFMIIWIIFLRKKGEKNLNN
ncbi:MAG: Ig-like domain-containing protein, partial [bacterium]